MSEEESQIKLKKFADEMLQLVWDGAYAIDGWDIQQTALDCGILKEVTMLEPCGEFCTCADVDSAFPAICLRKNYD